ncbi:MAG: ABC transporter substrate-binding protein [Acidobacteria bacterium]|nr:ABC transporter substrate-binding protein [Acidobacteriota bacterium]
MLCTRILCAVALPLTLAASTAIPAAPDARTVTDAVGRKVRVPARPERIISLAPNLTDILGDLGVGSRLVGVTDFCKPPAGSSPARVGGLMNPDLEKIVSLKPDLVVATTSGNYVEDRDRMERIGIPVYTCDTPSVESILSTISELGDVTGADEAAGRVVASLRARLEAVAKRVAGVSRPRVLFVLWGDPLLVPGKGTFMSDALERAGADSISKDLSARWAEVDLETVISRHPEILLTVPDNAAFAKEIASKPGWSEVAAVKSGRVHVLSTDILQPGPRIVDAIEEIAGILHPIGHPISGTSAAPR